MEIMHIHKAATVACAAVTLLALAGNAPAGQPDNAALLYYQAFLLYEKPDSTMENLLSDFRSGKIAANDMIREHVEKNRRIIDYAVKAANLPHCDWGYDYSQGMDLALPNGPGLRRVVFLLAADAALLAEQGDCQTALDRGLTIYRMSAHTTDRTIITYLLGVALAALADRTIQETLAVVPGDIEMLSRLKAQVEQFQNAFPSLEYTLAQEAQVCAASISKEKVPMVIRMASQDNPDFATSPAGTRILAGDEPFFERNRTHWFNTNKTLIGAVQSKLSYPQMYAKLQELGEQFGKEYQANPDGTFTALMLPPIHRIYVLTTRLQTHFNALRTGTDLVKARTGRLPVPPRRHAAGPVRRSAVREKSDGGFVLRCRSKGDVKPSQWFEFKISNEWASTKVGEPSFSTGALMRCCRQFVLVRGHRRWSCVILVNFVIRTSCEWLCSLEDRSSGAQARQPAALCRIYGR
jgi:hypothetical protein